MAKSNKVDYGKSLDSAAKSTRSEHHSKTESKPPAKKKKIIRLPIEVTDHSGKLLSVDKINDLIREELETSDKASTRAMLYLLFEWMTWEYLNQQGQQGWVAHLKSLDISTTQFYRYSKVTAMLMEHYGMTPERVIPTSGQLFTDEAKEDLAKLFNPINKVGISRLEEISHCKPEDKKRELLDGTIEKKTPPSVRTLRDYVEGINKKYNKAIAASKKNEEEQIPDTTKTYYFDGDRFMVRKIEQFKFVASTSKEWRTELEKDLPEIARIKEENLKVEIVGVRDEEERKLIQRALKDHRKL